LTGLRTTTGGIGREPGMLIRTRVVNVVSVFGTSSSGWPAPPIGGCEAVPNGSPEAPCANAAAPGSPVPYGGVPEG
jgi:hypothetical protein